MITTASYAIYMHIEGTRSVRRGLKRSSYNAKVNAVSFMLDDRGVYATLESLPLGGERLGGVGIVVSAAVDESGGDTSTANLACR